MMNIIRILGISLCLALAVRYGHAAPAPTRMTVAPATAIAATQVVGQEPVPKTFSYRMTSNRGSINWRIGALPNWIRANALKGKTAATVVLTVQPQTAPGVYDVTIPFIASTNTVTISARLIVTKSASPPPTQTSYCLDGVGGKVTTDAGEQLTCP